MRSDELNFKVHSLRTLSSPYSRSNDSENTFETIYYLLVNMRDLPDNIPLDVNPRKPRMTTNVAKSLRNAVIEPETDFYVNNRGIVISAKTLTFDTSKSEVHVNLGKQDDENDMFTYGILDGGHTYSAIIQEREEIPKDMDKYVRIEVITDVQNITRLSEARNKSVAVTDIALFNSDNNFDNIKAAIENEPFGERIAYKDYEDKEIHISELLRLMYAFDIQKFPDDNAAPVQSYSGKNQVFKRYETAYDTAFYKSLALQLPKLVALYDIIEKELPEKYKEYKESMGISRPRFDMARGVDLIPAKNGSNRNAYTMYLKQPIKYKISTGYIFPIFGAFRSLLQFDENTGHVSWLFDPLKIWDDIGKALVQNIFESSNNPQLAGKDKQLWLSTYRIVETQSLRKLLISNR